MIRNLRFILFVMIELQNKVIQIWNQKLSQLILLSAKVKIKGSYSFWGDHDLISFGRDPWKGNLQCFAERGGFEPPVRRKANNGFRDRRIRPLCHLSNIYHLTIYLSFKAISRPEKLKYKKPSFRKASL